MAAEHKCRACPLAGCAWDYQRLRSAENADTDTVEEMRRPRSHLSTSRKEKAAESLEYLEEKEGSGVA